MPIFPSLNYRRGPDDPRKLNEVSGIEPNRKFYGTFEKKKRENIVTLYFNSFCYTAFLNNCVAQAHYILLSLPRSSAHLLNSRDSKQNLAWAYCRTRRRTTHKVCAFITHVLVNRALWDFNWEAVATKAKFRSFGSDAFKFHHFVRQLTRILCMVASVKFMVPAHKSANGKPYALNFKISWSNCFPHVPPAVNRCVRYRIPRLRQGLKLRYQVVLNLIFEQVLSTLTGFFLTRTLSEPLNS